MHRLREKKKIIATLFLLKAKVPYTTLASKEMSITHIFNCILYHVGKIFATFRTQSHALPVKLMP